MSTVECANCHSSVPAPSRFCPECGRPLVEARRDESIAMRRLWPREWGLAAVVLLGGAGIVLLSARAWLPGILLLLLAVGVLLAQRAAERRAGRAVVRNVRSRLAAQRDLVSARSRGQIDLFRLRRELAELQAERSRGFLELGRAGYVRDRGAVQAARARLDDVGARLAAKEAEVEALLAQMRERVRRVQAQSAPTRTLEAPPEPPRLPEPYPPPDEGEPPGPVTVPEPGPVTVPEPGPVPAPEPSPGQLPPPPGHTPSPQTRHRRASRARRG